MSEQVNVNIQLHPVQALALAQFVKRMGFKEARDNAVDEREAYIILEGIAALQMALSEEGFSHR